MKRCVSLPYETALYVLYPWTVYIDWAEPPWAEPPSKVLTKATAGVLVLNVQDVC